MKQPPNLLGGARCNGEPGMVRTPKGWVQTDPNTPSGRAARRRKPGGDTGSTCTDSWRFSLCLIAVRPWDNDSTSLSVLGLGDKIQGVDKIFQGPSGGDIPPGKLVQLWPDPRLQISRGGPVGTKRHLGTCRATEHRGHEANCWVSMLNGCIEVAMATCQGLGSKQ